MSPLSLPVIEENASGWGPPTSINHNLLPDFLRDLPFHNFTKAERSSRVADWSANLNRLGIASIRRDPSSHLSGLFENVEEDSEFHLVDSKSATKKVVSRSGRMNNRSQRSNNTSRSTSNYNNQRNNNNSNRNRNMSGGGNKNQRFMGRRYGNDNRRSDVSLNINPEWGDPVAIFEFGKMAKTKDYDSSFVLNNEVLLECGQVGYFNSELPKTITSKAEVFLKRNHVNELTFPKVTSSDDPNFRNLAAQGKGNVFMTDSIFSFLMAVHRSYYPWDLVINKHDGQIWFDVRSSRVDMITVNENATDPPDIDQSVLNTPNKLSQEAVFIQNNFSQQVLLKEKFYIFPYTNPFSNHTSGDNPLAPIGYRYCRLVVSSDLTLIVRCEIDAVLPTKDGHVSSVSIRTLNEYDSKVTGDWRKKLQNQPGGVLATELKNNMFKIQRWVVQSLLAKCDTIVLGFISRQTPNDNINHSILSVESYKPTEFVSQMSMNLDRMWAVLKTLLERISEEPDGKYLLVKEPQSSGAKLYRIP